MPRDWAGICSCVFVAVLILGLSWFKLGSVDLGYHVAYGRHFLDTGHIVEVDPFLYPQNAKRFINANWLSQVVMAFVERQGGSTGLILLRVFLVAVIFASIGIVVRRVTRGLLWLALAWLFAAIPAYERFSLRPELFSYAAMAVLLVLLAGPWRSRWILLAVAGLQVAWVNLHSYFLIGPMLTACWLIGEVVQHLRSRGSPTVASPAAGRVRLLVATLVVQTAACLVNPRHVEGAVFPIKTLSYLSEKEVMGSGQGWSGDSAWSAISEFKSPFSFLGEISGLRTIQAYFVLLAAAALALPILLARWRIAEALAVVLMLVMSTQMRRNIAQFAFVAAPLSMGAFSMLAPWSAGAARAARLARITLAALTIGAAGWWTYGIVQGRFYYDERRVNREFGLGYNERIFPRAATEWLAGQSELQPNLYVNYFASSNTLIWLPERFKLFVDTNTFAYDDALLGTDYKLGQGQIDYRKVFDENGINVALLHCGSNTHVLIMALAKDFTNWALVYFDRYAVVFVRRIIPHVPVMKAHQLSEKDLNPHTWIDSITSTGPQRATELAVTAGVPLSLGWHRPAVVLCEEAVRIAPDYHEAWQYLGVCHGNLGNEATRAGDMAVAIREYEAAAECFEKVLSLRPGDPQALQFGEMTIRHLQNLAARQAQSQPGAAAGK